MGQHGRNPHPGRIFVEEAVEGAQLSAADYNKIVHGLNWLLEQVEYDNRDFKIKMLQIDDERIKMQIWDTAGQ